MWKTILRTGSQIHLPMIEEVTADASEKIADFVGFDGKP